MRPIYLFIFFISVIHAALFAQSDHKAVVIRMQSSHTSFPDSNRLKGYTGNQVYYSTPDHYSDNHVLIVVPDNLKADKKVNLIFWFHGWHNNIDTALAYYKLTRQLINSGVNAVLVLPEAAKDAADSYGGKLEKPGIFAALVADVLQELKNKKIIGSQSQAGHIFLAGHSGGGEVIAFIVEKGQMEINEVILFDALYGGTEKFMAWIKSDTTHRFIHLCTDYGFGPKDESEHMTLLLKKEQIAFFETEESGVTPQEIKNNKLLFIHSLSQHNDIIFNPDNFSLLIANSPLLKN